MDPATMGGIGLAFGALMASMVLEGGSPMAIVSPAAMLLVFGGTFGAAMAGGILSDTKAVIGSLKLALTAKPRPTNEVVPMIVSMAERARREGLLSLEDALRDCDDEFLKRGLELAVDGTDPEELREILEAELYAKRAADKHGAKFFMDMGGYAPTIGIIGTVIGLVHVLENLSQPDKLGHLIAGAFIATLWGVMSANMMWLPMGNRLRRLGEIEATRMELVVEGVLAIQAGSNPRIVAQKLSSLLAEHERTPAEQAA
ncbi:MAG: motility protein A [Nocardioidaceae bacterium]